MFYWSPGNKDKIDVVWIYLLAVGNPRVTFWLLRARSGIFFANDKISNVSKIYCNAHTAWVVLSETSRSFEATKASFHCVNCMPERFELHLRCHLVLRCSRSFSALWSFLALKYKNQVEGIKSVVSLRQYGSNTFVQPASNLRKISLSFPTL